MNVIKMTISESIQNDADAGLISSTLVVSMSVMYSAFKIMDDKYKPSNKQMTKIPNLGMFVMFGEIKNPSMHTKYNVMHESWMMEEIALMLSLVATSIIHLMINPASGKYFNVDNNDDDDCIVYCDAGL